MILCKASQTAISKAVCYKTKNEQLREKAVHFLLVATNCFLHHYSNYSSTSILLEPIWRQNEKIGILDI